VVFWDIWKAEAARSAFISNQAMVISSGWTSDYLNPGMF